MRAWWTLRVTIPRPPLCRNGVLPTELSVHIQILAIQPGNDPGSAGRQPTILPLKYWTMVPRIRIERMLPVLHAGSLPTELSRHIKLEAVERFKLSAYGIKVHCSNQLSYTAIHILKFGACGWNPTSLHSGCNRSS